MRVRAWRIVLQSGTESLSRMVHLNGTTLHL